ncbi:hypothetical protein [Rickettsia endosymbiont of Nabis limbatus]|uniref:hypothetical protein n=1 Tax=Rickettsia endosymbiont of Nabis limbatus TaxID=3066268 RepID=UPI003AF3F16E
MGRNLETVCQMLIPMAPKENISYIDNDDRTLLILAIQKGMKLVCEMLISRMIEDKSLDILNHVISKGKLKGESALSLAKKQEGFEDICKSLQTQQDAYEDEEKFEEPLPKKTILEDINELSIKMKDSANINKNIVEYSIDNKIKKLSEDSDLSKIHKDIQDIIDYNNNSKEKLLALKDHLNQIIDAQTINTEQQISLEALGDVSVEFSNFRGV